jgi:hypothetical protein
MTEPGSYDAREGSGDPTTDPAAIGEVRLGAKDGDGGAVPDAPSFPEPGTGDAEPTGQ